MDWFAIASFILGLVGASPTIYKIANKVFNWNRYRNIKSLKKQMEDLERFKNDYSYLISHCSLMVVLMAAICFFAVTVMDIEHNVSDRGVVVNIVVCVLSLFTGLIIGNLMRLRYDLKNYEEAIAKLGRKIELMS